MPVWLLPMLKGHWKALGAGLVLFGLVAALGIQTWRISSLKDDNRQLTEGIGRIKEKMAVTQASLDETLGQIDDNNKRIAAAAARLAQDRTLAAQDLARANARWESTGARVRALEASARDTAQPACKVSERASQALEGL